MSSLPSTCRNQPHRGQHGQKGHDVRLSKKLSYILRHGAVKAGLHMDEAGWVKLNDLLSSPGFTSYTRDDVLRCGQQNDKQRFSILEDVSGTAYIRANQGHSGDVAQCINPEKLLQRLQLADLQPDTICVHGTTLQAWESIKKEGLSRMRRQMIHCAAGLPGDDGVISGMRSSSSVLVYVDIHEAVKDGIPFFRSANHVLLSPGLGESGMLPTTYFKEIHIRNLRHPLIVKNEYE